MRTRLKVFEILCLAGMGLVLGMVGAMAGSIEQVALSNATVRSFGPTSTPWFHTAQGPGRYQGYAISSFRFPEREGSFKIEELIIHYTETEAEFTREGPLLFFITFDPEVAKGEYGGLRHRGGGSHGIDDQEFTDNPSTLGIGSGYFEREFPGAEHSFPLEIDEEVRELLSRAVEGSEGFSIIVAAPEDSTAATFAGIENTRFPNSIRLELRTGSR